MEGGNGEEDRGWTTKPVKKSHGIAVWKLIKELWEEFARFIEFEVGNGRRKKFWLDKWCDTMTFAEKFCNLCILSNMKEAVVAEVYSGSTANISWNLRFISAFNDWNLKKKIICLYYSKISIFMRRKKTK